MKRTISTVALAVLLALVTTAMTAAAPKPSIEDPLGDANFINDQGTGDGSFGDFNQADAGTVSDLVSVTFSNDKKNLYVQVQTEAAPPATTGIGYRVRVNPDGSGGSYCLEFLAFHPGANNALSAPIGYAQDLCEGGDRVEIKVLGTQLVIPRSLSKALAGKATLKAPQAQAFLYSGNESAGSTYPVADTTKVGTDFKLK